MKSAAPKSPYKPCRARLPDAGKPNQNPVRRPIMQNQGHITVSADVSEKCLQVARMTHEAIAVGFVGFQLVAIAHADEVGRNQAPQSLQMRQHVPPQKRRSRDCHAATRRAVRFPARRKPCADPKPSRNAFGAAMRFLREADSPGKVYSLNHSYPLALTGPAPWPPQYSNHC